MPKRTPELVVAYIAGSLTLDPSISYPSIVRHVAENFNGFKISVEGAKKIAVRECPKLDPMWEKVNPLIGEYSCQFRLPNGRRHLKMFKGQVGYSGANARFCPEHRTGKHSVTGVEEEARKTELTRSFLNATDDASPAEQKELEKKYFEELT